MDQGAIRGEVEEDPAATRSRQPSAPGSASLLVEAAAELALAGNCAQVGRKLLERACKLLEVAGGAFLWRSGGWQLAGSLPQLPRLSEAVQLAEQGLLAQAPRVAQPGAGAERWLAIPLGPQGALLLPLGPARQPDEEDLARAQALAGLGRLALERALACEQLKGGQGCAGLDAQPPAPQMQALLDALPEAAVMYRPTGEIEMLNARASQLLSLGDEERWRPYLDHARSLGLENGDGQPMAPAESPVGRALMGEVVNGELVAFGTGGGRPEKVWTWTGAAPWLSPDGAVAGVVATFADVSGLHRAQERSDDLLRIVSHDLRTPLSAVLMQAQMLKRFADNPEKVAKGADSIAVNARRMNAMIHDLVDMGRLEAGTLGMQRKYIELQPFVRYLRDRLAGSLPMERVELMVPEELPVIWADPDRLERVLVNLLSNAIKYSPAGSPVRLCAWPQERWVWVSVSDEGQGIAREDFPRIFERYFRAQRSARSEGLGLGLYICRMLVEAHGGRLEVESTVGRGSTFRFSMPVADEAGIDEEALPRKDVLVVDDDTALCEAICSALQSEGYSVEEASDGQQALQALSRSRPSLITLDLKMPHLDGHGVLRALKAHPAWSAIPVVVCAGHSPAATGVSPSDAAAFVEKPLRLEVLLSAVHRLIGAPATSNTPH